DICYFYESEAQFSPLEANQFEVILVNTKKARFVSNVPTGEGNQPLFTAIAMGCRFALDFVESLPDETFIELIAKYHERQQPTTELEFHFIVAINHLRTLENFQSFLGARTARKFGFQSPAMGPVLVGGDQSVDHDFARSGHSESSTFLMANHGGIINVMGHLKRVFGDRAYHPGNITPALIQQQATIRTPGVNDEKTYEATYYQLDERRTIIRETTEEE
ncbi:MAG: hypothetical protein AAF203_11465, partial [Pseudomonadota bacterium]